VATSRLLRDRRRPFAWPWGGQGRAGDQTDVAPRAGRPESLVYQSTRPASRARRLLLPSFSNEERCDPIDSDQRGLTKRLAWFKERSRTIPANRMIWLQSLPHRLVNRRHHTAMSAPPSVLAYWGAGFESLPHHLGNRRHHTAMSGPRSEDTAPAHSCVEVTRNRPSAMTSKRPHGKVTR
jgi:hypothetical protein